MDGIQENTDYYDAWREDFKSALAETERYYLFSAPQNRSIGVFAHAARVALNFDPFDMTVREMYDGHHHRRGKDIDPHVAVNLLLRGYQADQLLYNPENYPISDELNWIEVFGEIENDDTRWGILRNNIASKDVQSNIAERYKTVQLLASLMKDRFGSQPSHLDVGSSVLQGDVKLAFNNMPNFGIGVFNAIELLKNQQTNEIVVDHRLSNLANLAIKQRVEYSDMVGIDITSVNDEVIKQWAKSCSFYPDELRNKEKVAEYDLLSSLDPYHERVKFYRADFSELNLPEFKKWSPRQKFDIITFSTILYQVTESEKQQMLANARDLLSDNGVILVQDDPEGHFQKSFGYISSVYDGPNAVESQDILRWENGRCNRAIVELGRVAFDGCTEKTLEQALIDQFEC